MPVLSLLVTALLVTALLLCSRVQGWISPQQHQSHLRHLALLAFHRNLSKNSSSSSSSYLSALAVSSSSSDTKEKNDKTVDNNEDSSNINKADMVRNHYIPLAEKTRAYLTASTDPFHAVANAVKLLKSHGFTKWSPIKGSSSYSQLQPGGKYYYTVQQSTLVAFAVGGQAQVNDSTTVGSSNAVTPFCIIGGHTDSPNFRLKPRSKCTMSTSPSHGCIQLGVECYGGGLWHTWLDRDLSVSGKVLVRDKADSNNSPQTKIKSRLVQLSDPIARISSLCIHLQTADERKSLTLNRETHTVPIIASSSSSLLSPGRPFSTTPMLMEGALEEQLNANIPEPTPSATTSLPADEKDDQNTSNDDMEGAMEEHVDTDDEQGNNISKTKDPNSDDENCPWRKGQEPLLLKRIAQEMGIDVQQIADWELSLYDTQPASLGGLHSEFLYSGRLDNLATVFCAVTALCEHANNEKAFDQSRHISLICAFDHEEVGSVSSNGAGSPVLEQALRQISRAMGQDDPYLYPTVVSQSFCMSVDQAHAIHPNYASKHESAHGPTLNTGLVIKSNSNQRYATNSVTGFIMVRVEVHRAITTREQNKRKRVGL